ncbi:hypothetical protein BDV59DRAFT_26022 [Aspergillus ambiguus]|uniref:cohesin subunit IRR1 n=1 Tax=Aspergillus ambiguus TaxID=176160 RepID=UPI003CCD6CA1
MDTESQLTTPHPEATQVSLSPSSTDRRKSGRTTRRPELFSQRYSDATGSKRKRDPSNPDNDDDDVDDDQDLSESESDDPNDDEPDEEELRERKLAARKASRKAVSGSKPKSRSAKKPRVAGHGVGSRLALRPAINGKKSSRQPRVRDSLAVGEKGLFAEVFGKGRDADTTAADWLTQYRSNSSEAIKSLVEFVLRCAGINFEVPVDEIDDENAITGCVEEMQELYKRNGISEYPLISRSRKYRAFQPVLEDFFQALFQTFHHSSVLYDDPSLYENISRWIAVLSASLCRPFRHTATVIFVAIMNTLCDIAQQLMTLVSTSRKQLENETKKKSVNKGRVAAIESAIEEGENKLQKVDYCVADGVKVIFYHRYRDVDAHIRSISMAALGHWIRAYREHFMDGEYLRILGWILSDPSVEVRSVVLHQLISLFADKANIGGLHPFTSRFRKRVVEVAAFDADVGVRASAIELARYMRDAELLQPADIDTIGKLVFDAEARIRKAAGGFFTSNVEDVFDSMMKEVSDDADDLLGEEDEDDFGSPKRSWVKFKCLVDILGAYDESADESQQDQDIIAPRDALSGASADSRFMLATEAIYPHLSDLSQWQSLAGYLLYDHSQIEDDPSEDDIAGTVRKLYKLQEGQEAILLEVLCCAVKLRVLEVAKLNTDRRGRKAKALIEKIPELQEEIAHNLAQIIPQLLNKFGSVPEAASTVLRLEHLVDLDKIQDIQKDATAYISLLNDINKQFLTHSDQDVLAEASVAFVHARSSDDMRDALDSKIQELWEDMADTLNTLYQKKDVSEGRSVPTSTLNDLTNTVARISNLASVTDCIQALESVPTRSKGKRKDSSECPFNVLMHLAKRGLRKDEDDEETAAAETELVTSSIRTLLLYFMWKVQSLTRALNAGNANLNTAYFEALTKSRETFVATLVAIMKKRPNLDDIRFVATTTLLDLQTLFGTLRHAGQMASNDEDVLFQKQSLIHEITGDVQSLISKIHGVAERTFSRKIRIHVEPAHDDEPLSDSDEEVGPTGEANAVNEAIMNERLRSAVVAEQRLCELTGKIVLAIIARIIDASGPQSGQLKKKLSKHKSHLGRNYQEVIAIMAEPKPKRVRSGQSKGKQPAAKDPSSPTKRPENSKSAERVDDVDDADEPEEHSHIEEDGEDDLRARGLVENDDMDRENEDDVDDLAPPVSDEDEVMGD